MTILKLVGAAAMFTLLTVASFNFGGSGIVPRHSFEVKNGFLTPGLEEGSYLGFPMSTDTVVATATMSIWPEYPGSVKVEDDGPEKTTLFLGQRGDLTMTLDLESAENLGPDAGMCTDRRAACNHGEEVSLTLHTGCKILGKGADIFGKLLVQWGATDYDVPDAMKKLEERCNVSRNLNTAVFSMSVVLVVITCIVLVYPGNSAEKGLVVLMALLSTALFACAIALMAIVPMLNAGLTEFFVYKDTKTMNGTGFMLDFLVVLSSFVLAAIFMVWSYRTFLSGAPYERLQDMLNDGTFW